ncbi:MoaD/ThiS family protein [Isosphaera pallida]|jgi:molybdopterin converting factor small subunit|nr:MoaD/ThiS family protein [Isosphaera pallida]
MLRAQTGGKDTLEVPGGTVAEVLARVAADHPDLGERMYKNGELQRFLNIYLNDEDVRYLDHELNEPVKETDEIAIIPNVAGG